jgi:regulator of RNase E activity RraA
MNDELMDTLAALSTSAVSDAMDRLGIPGQCLAIMPLDHDFRLVGRAWTLRYGPVGRDVGTVGDYIDDLGPGDVVVLDNQGRLDATVWGDLLTETASRRGVSGTVIDGVCRDRDRTRELQYPIFSRGHWMRTGKDRVRVEQTGGPVTIGGVRVEAGDLMFGDGDGLVALPADRGEEIVAAAVAIESVEAAIREAVRGGQALRDARAELRYHKLQRRAHG